MSGRSWSSGQMPARAARLGHQPATAIPPRSVSSSGSGVRSDTEREFSGSSVPAGHVSGFSVTFRLCQWHRRTRSGQDVYPVRGSVVDPGSLPESRPELHTELVMTTRACSRKPLARRRLSKVAGSRTELHLSALHAQRIPRRETLNNNCACATAFAGPVAKRPLWSTGQWVSVYSPPGRPTRASSRPSLSRIS